MWKRKALQWAIKNVTRKRVKTGMAMGKMAYAGYKAYKGNPKVANSRDYGGVTQQQDSRTLYRNKKMPYRKKKKWRSFVKKVDAVEIGNRAKSTLIINTASVVNATAGTQGWSETHLYSIEGDVSGTRDMSILLEDVKTYKDSLLIGTPSLSNWPGTTVPDTVNPSAEDTRREILLSSGTLDVTYTNTGFTAMELDMYTIEYPRQQQGTNGNLIASLDTNPEYVPTIKVWNGSAFVTTTAVSRTQRGVTLFDLAYGLSRTAAKIMKKEKYFILPGSSITKTIRDPKNHTFRRTSRDTIFAHKNLTKTLCVSFKSVDTIADAQLQQKSTRSYKYTYEGGVTPFNRFNQE